MKCRFNIPRFLPGRGEEGVASRERERDADGEIGPGEEGPGKIFWGASNDKMLTRVFSPESVGAKPAEPR